MSDKNEKKEQSQKSKKWPSWEERQRLLVENFKRNMLKKYPRAKTKSI